MKKLVALLSFLLAVAVVFALWQEAKYQEMKTMNEQLMSEMVEMQHRLKDCE